MNGAFLRPIPLCFFLFLLLLVSPLMSALAGAVVISDYQVISKAGCDRTGRELLAIRSFAADGERHFLAVDPATFKSFDIPACSFTVSGGGERLTATLFERSLNRCTAPPYRLQNHGLTHARQGGGAFLTVDLCPSRRPFERTLFDAVGAMGKGAPVPVAVAVSGAWLKTHPDEFSYLVEAARSKTLAITWVNHSLDHPFDPKRPLADNFLLTPGTDFDREVLQVEEMLLSRGVVPSPFFRFPGLVADGATLKRLRELSLIPVGSDAWLAKGEEPREGSIILVHGNGNEPKGVKLLLPLLKGLKLRPLSDAFQGPKP